MENKQSVPEAFIFPHKHILDTTQGTYTTQPIDINWINGFYQNKLALEKLMDSAILFLFVIWRTLVLLHYLNNISRFSQLQLIHVHVIFTLLYLSSP